MGIVDFQEFIETQCKDACVSVDLLQIARSYATAHSRKAKQSQAYEDPCNLCIAVDAESCLDRLYGGFYSDWVCGGQWNRMVQFLSHLIEACENSGLHLSVIFSGALETQHMKLNEWFTEQLENRKNANKVLKHINSRGTPPPKVWWLPPVALGWCMRMALRTYVDIACTMEDHKQEVMGYCREYNLHGIFAHDAEYAIFDPPRYFSSQNMKLTYKGSLETKEYIIDQVAKCLNLHPNRFCVLAALLGNHILGEIDLQEFFKELLSIPSEQKGYKLDSTKLIQEVVAFVRSLPSAENLDSIGEIVFRKCNERLDKIARFKLSVQYYLNGTQEGFLKYRPKNKRTYGVTRQAGSYPTTQSKPQPAKPPSTDVEPASDSADQKTGHQEKPTTEPNVYTETETGYGQDHHPSAPEIRIEDEEEKDSSKAPTGDGDLESKLQAMSLEPEKVNGGDVVPVVKPEPNRLDANLISSSSSSSSGSSPSRLSPDPTFIVNVGPVKKTAPSPSKPRAPPQEKPMPTVLPEIMRVASERHQKGLMLPWVYQVLSEGEIKIPVSLEPEQPHSLPLSHELYRPIRVQCYAMLYNLNKKKREQDKHLQEKKSVVPKEPLEVTVKEWMVMSSQDKTPRCTQVVVKPLVDWVPTLECMWLGQKPEYKEYRLNMFFSVLKCNNLLMKTPSYVPQHLVIMCAVLRYLLQCDWPVLQRAELDAFLAQSVSPLLQDVQTMQDMKLPVISGRAVHLASLFMHGVESAIFVNDVCGVPIYWEWCCPWNFFDGKLFHYKMLKANNNASLLDMCDGNIDQVMRVEKMRLAILEGLPPAHFAKPTLAGFHAQSQGYNPYNSYPMANTRPAGAPFVPPQKKGGGRGRGLLGEFASYGDYRGGQTMDQRGASLQIAGQVVSSWGPTSHERGRGMHIASGHSLYNSTGPGRGRKPARKSRGRGGRKAQPHELENLGAGRGRGCTIENPADGQDMSVKELMIKEETLLSKEESSDITLVPETVDLVSETTDDSEQFADADPDVTIKSEPIQSEPVTPEGAPKPAPIIQTPDSGIEAAE